MRKYLGGQGRGKSWEGADCIASFRVQPERENSRVFRIAKPRRKLKARLYFASRIVLWKCVKYKQEKWVNFRLGKKRTIGKRHQLIVNWVIKRVSSGIENVRRTMPGPVVLWTNVKVRREGEVVAFSSVMPDGRTVRTTYAICMRALSIMRRLRPGKKSVGGDVSEAKSSARMAVPIEQVRNRLRNVM